MPRNFTCPQTNEPCDEGGCKKGVLCVLEERERANARASQEAARERRRRVGWVNPATSRGTFSLRSPARPNPIGTSIAKLVSIEGAIVTVRGLDCLDGTPLLDLKPDRELFKPIAPPQPGDFQVGEP